MKGRIKRLVAGLAGARGTPLKGGFGTAGAALPRRVLVLRDGGLGDMILTAPVLRTLREALGSQARIDLMCRASSAAVIEGTVLADTIARVGDNPFQSLPAIRALRHNEYDLVIDLVLSASLSWALRLLAVAPRAVRVGGEKGDLAGMFDLNAPLPPRHTQHFLERLRAVAFAALGDFPFSDAPPWLVYPEEVRQRADRVWTNLGGDGRRVVWVNISAGNARRRWPIERYRALLERLLADETLAAFRWVLSSAPEDSSGGKQLVAALHDPGCVLLPIEKDFRVLIEMLKHAALVLTPDTSMVHAASAVGRPVVVLSVAENAVTWAPWKVPCEVVSAPPGEPAGRIRVHEVAQALRRLCERI